MADEHDMPPEWAIKEALDRGGARNWSVADILDMANDPTPRFALELARMIAKHEPPVDPVEAAVEAIMAQRRFGDPTITESVRAAARAGIAIAEGRAT